MPWIFEIFDLDRQQKDLMSLSIHYDSSLGNSFSMICYFCFLANDVMIIVVLEYEC